MWSRASTKQLTRKQERRKGQKRALHSDAKALGACCSGQGHLEGPGEGDRSVVVGDRFGEEAVGGREGRGSVDNW